MRRPTVILAGGGTGGHVFPLVAVAHALCRQCPEIHPVFVGTSRGMETRFVPEQGFELELLDVLPLRGRGVGGAVKGALRAAALLPESRALLKKYGPSGVLSIGGYAAGPISLAARTMGIPLALIEPNSVIGLANRLIAPFVQRAYLAFEEAEKNFSPQVIVRSGVPLRPGFEPSPLRALEGPLRILVLGGSQGAKSLNEVVPRALFQSSAPLRIVHQCGQAHIEAVRSLYDSLQQGPGRCSASITPFIEDMPRALEQADLVIARSGASAVSEIAAVGRPSLLVPYPFASGDHQRINAESLQSRGAALCIPHEMASVSRIAKEVERLANDRETLQSMARAARQMGRPDASLHIATDFLRLSAHCVPRPEVA